jgi:prepilin-type N-terminal cleavage/methylation domain-containing protein
MKAGRQPPSNATGGETTMTLAPMPEVPGVREKGFGLIEILLVLAIAAVLMTVLYNSYFSPTQKALERFQSERPLSQARLASDRATLTALRSAAQLYLAKNGQWPPSKEALGGLVNPPPHLQCAGNDLLYDPATGQITLLIDDSHRC